VLSRKVFFRCFEGPNKIWTSKTSPSGRQAFVHEHGRRVIPAAQQLEILHVPHVATNDPFSESHHSIFATSYLLRETMNSLRGTKLAFSGTMNSLRGAKLAFSGKTSSLMGINTVLREIIDSEVKTIFEHKRYYNSLGPMTVTDNGFFGCHAA